ncbi:C-C motif chemokine 21 isoform X1 [Myotis lucifugus]|uniref:C-C motif chemokine 21 isoform X1 n=1 Tax=Myotis lucifugus TaxID=59463 RepID=UPI000CCC5C95|nr:C-C motif chemokine 21 isoform X1 [Myotis lucifugus]
MAQSLALSLLFLVLAFCIPWTQGSDGGAQDCCLKYSVRKIPDTLVRSYRKQEPSLGCPIPAILFSPRKRSQAELCADPKEAWVQRLMQRLDTSPAPRKPAQRSKKDKSGKKRKGCKGCKSPSSPFPGLKSPRPPKSHSPVISLEPRGSPSAAPGFGASIPGARSGLEDREDSGAPEQSFYPHAGLASSLLLLQLSLPYF